MYLCALSNIPLARIVAGHEDAPQDAFKRAWYLSGKSSINGYFLKELWTVTIWGFP